MPVKIRNYEDLKPGDYIGDMHYGISALLPYWDLIDSRQWEVTPATMSFPKLDNKELRVLGFNRDGYIVCGYNYDGRFSGIVTLAPKNHQL